MERSRPGFLFRFSDGGRWPRSPFGDWAMRGAGSVLAGVLRGVEAVQDVALEMGVDIGANLNTQDAEVVSKWLATRGWPARPLQVGVLDPEGWGASLMEAPGVLTVDWIALNDAEVARGEMPEALDAVVACFPDGRLCVRAEEHENRGAAWFDWAYERPRSYPGTFPMRVDCAQLTIASRSPGLSPDSRLSRLLVEATALLSRHPARVELEDSLAGRLTAGAGADVTGAVYAQHHEHARADALAPVMRQLVELMGPWELGELRSPAGKVAARLMGAWAASAASDRVDQTLRRLAADMAGAVIDDEVETMLRVGAVRMADGDEVAGLHALELAARMLKGSTIQNPPDQVVFLLTELGGVRHDPYAIGRVAGGLVLVGATTPAERFPHLRDDILDEMKHSGALIDLEQYQLVILKTLGMLERVLGASPMAQRIVDEHAEAELAEGTAGGFGAGPGITWSMMPKVSRGERVEAEMPVGEAAGENTGAGIVPTEGELPPVTNLKLPGAGRASKPGKARPGKQRTKRATRAAETSAPRKNAAKAKKPVRGATQDARGKGVVGRIGKGEKDRRGRKAA